MLEDKEKMIKQRIKGNLIRGMAEVFEYAIKQRCDISAFTKRFLQSETFSEYFEDDTLNCQSAGYIYDVYMDEELNGSWCDYSYGDNPDAAHWIGYLLAAWHIEDGISGVELAEKYIVEDLKYDYPALHTQDIFYAIDCIKEDRERAE